MARRLEDSGADALVLFNRFYQPDIDIDALDVTPALTLADSHTLLMRLRWLAAIFGHVGCALVVGGGGVHTGRDALKALMAGASAVQMTSAVLRNGPGQVKANVVEMDALTEEHEFESVAQMIGSMSLAAARICRASSANYMKVLQSWRFGTVM